tara:strand:- start:871 stop:1848 length:978 start_codon:yes stop_codon:yes gene_type:complete
MPEDKKPSDELIDVGETEGAEINLDEKGEAVKQEEVVEEKIEVEQVPEDKTYENDREVKLDEKKKPAEDKDELKEYSEGVQKRIAKLTRKMREAERQREEAVSYAQSIKQQKDAAENRLSKLDKSYVSEFENRVTTSMAAAKLALKNAIESQDVEAQIAAQEQLANLTVESARVNALKAVDREKPSKEKEVNITPQQQQTPTTDPKAEEWASRNGWFGNDSAMTYTAFDIHKTLVEKEGYDPKTDEYYEEVDKRIRLEFPHKFDKIEGQTTERAKPAQNVASAKRSSSTGRRKTVKLSPSQVAIAKRIGVPLEEYAKQLNITEGA